MKYPSHCQIQGHPLGGEDYDLTRGHLVCQNCRHKEKFSIAGMSLAFGPEVMQAMIKIFSRQHRRCKPRGSSRG